MCCTVMDGTLKIELAIFSQVFAIFAEALEGVHPLIYALQIYILPNKKEKHSLFKMLNQLKLELNPTCDFEQGY